MAEAWNAVKSLSDINLTKMTALETAFQNMYNITQACQYAGISRQTYYDWCRLPEFAEKMDVAQNMPLRKSREVIVKAIDDGDSGLALKVLQVRDPDFKRKSEVQINPDLEEIREEMKDFFDATDELDPPDEPPEDSEETVEVEDILDDSPEADDEDSEEA